MKFLFISLFFSIPLLFAQDSGVKPTIAVMDFECRQDPNLGWSVSEIVRTELVNVGIYAVVERSQLQKVFEEQKLQISGAMDESTAVHLGKLLGASQVIVGSVIKIGNTYTINSRLIAVSTAAAYKGETVSCQNENDISRICRKLALNISGKPAEEQVPQGVNRINSIPPDNRPRLEHVQPPIQNSDDAIHATGTGYPEPSARGKENRVSALMKAKAELVRDAMEKIGKLDFHGKPVSKLVENRPMARKILVEHLKRLSDPDNNGPRPMLEYFPDGKIEIQMSIPLHGEYGIYPLLENVGEKRNKR